MVANRITEMFKPFLLFQYVLFMDANKAVLSLWGRCRFSWTNYFKYNNMISQLKHFDNFL